MDSEAALLLVDAFDTAEADELSEDTDDEEAEANRRRTAGAAALEAGSSEDGVADEAWWMLVREDEADMDEDDNAEDEWDEALRGPMRC